MDLDGGKNKMSKSDDAVVVGRASPAGCADEDVHNPSVGGLGTSRGMLVLQKTDSSATTREKVMGRFRGRVEVRVRAV